MAAALLAMKVVSFNLLAHPYTKFQKEWHKQAAGVETADQWATRRARNASAIAAIGPDVLLLQEHDVGVAIDGYTTAVNAVVGDHVEGTSVLLRTGMPPPLAAWQLDIGDGKSAAFARLHSGLTVASVHLRGGPDSADAKRRQLDMVLAQLPGGHPAIVAGDMNEARPWEALDATMAAGGFTRLAPAGDTGLTSDLRTRLCIDHVYTRGVEVTAPLSLPLPVENPWEDGAVLGSDHAPLVFAVQPPASVADL
jgi:endonuclease/exonuclease/phosphatase family metal-dependent hydrolase